MQGLVVLPEDVQIIPLSEMPPQIRSQVSGDDGDFALTRPRSRVPSKVIDANSASLLRQFRSPRTIVDGLLAFSKEIKARPSDVLDDAYPLIESCLRARLLVEPGEASEKIEPSFAKGERIGDHVVEHPVQSLIDSEVYQVRTPTGRLGALKIATLRGMSTMESLLEREAGILTQLAGRSAPALLETGILSDGRHYILTEWFPGDDVQVVAHRLREQGTDTAARDLAEICADILDAYATLHDSGILHGDVHLRNVLAAESGEVRLVDFGIASRAESAQPARGGVAFFFDPQYADAVRNSRRAPALNVLAEQYSVAALIYSLLCGPHYLDFSYDKDELLRQIVEDKPLPFARHSAGGYARLEAVVLRALSKDPVHRFASTQNFASAFRQAIAEVAAPLVKAPVAAHESARLLERIMKIMEATGSPLEYVGPKSPTASVTYGYAGLAYAAYRLACAKDDTRLLAFADAWAERAARTDTEDAFYSPGIQITAETVGSVSPYHAVSGIAVVQTLLAHARGDRWTAEAALNAYLHHTSHACNNPDITLGHASILLGLMLLLEGESSTPDVLLARGDELNGRILEVLASEPAIGEPGAIEYLGMAHGWAGLLYASLRWAQMRKNEPKPIVRERLNQLAGQARFARRGARWPVQDKAGSISLAGWCNGSAGYTHLWTLAHQTWGEDRYLELARGSAMDAFEGTGGGPGLCCGFAGQAYAQLNVYKATGEAAWLQQAKELAEKAAALANALHDQNSEGLPFSLYKGDVGVALLIADLEKPELAAMPFFEAAG